MHKKILVLLSFLVAACTMSPDSETVAVLYKTVPNADGKEECIGRAVFHETGKTLEICIDAVGLTPGEHGFHIHQNGDCRADFKDGKRQNALKAGDHYDPGVTHVHAGPFGQGHAGDLPTLYADSAGVVHMCVTTSRLSMSEIIGRSVVIHAGGDNFSDSPLPLGGGGERVACGIIIKK